jgi:hypothetical protein
MSGWVADIFPTTLAFWLALSLAFLGNEARPGLMRFSGSLAAAALVLIIPVEGWMVFQWIAALESEPSITALALLFAGLVSRVGGPRLLRSCDWKTAWVFGAVASLLLFPSTIGLSSVDVYSWGWCKVFVIGVGFLALGLVVKGNRFGVVLLFSLVVFFLHSGESRNLWDELIDPLFGVVAVLVVALRIIFPGKRTMS